MSELNDLNNEKYFMCVHIELRKIFMEFVVENRY